MEFRQLQTFIQVAQHQSFSKAAQVLGYSQSAVTVQIRLLENELETRLFDRMGKKVLLTAQGKRILEQSTQILYEMEQLKSRVLETEDLKNPLHIGTIESLCTAKLPPILWHFRRFHPHVAIQITTASPEQLIRMMEQNELDLIYILDEIRWNPNWIKGMEAREPIVFVSSPSFALAKENDLLLDDLLDQPFFLTEKDANYRRALDQYLAAKHQTLSPILEISDTDFIIQMVEQTDGISFLPFFAVQDEIKAGRLSQLAVKNLDIFMYRQIFYHKSKFQTREMQEFIRLANLPISDLS